LLEDATGFDSLMSIRDRAYFSPVAAEDIDVSQAPGRLKEFGSTFEHPGDLVYDSQWVAGALIEFEPIP